LAAESTSMFRHLLLERQQRAIDALAVRWNAEAAAARRKSLAVDPRSGTQTPKSPA